MSKKKDKPKEKIIKNTRHQQQGRRTPGRNPYSFKSKQNLKTPKVNEKTEAFLKLQAFWHFFRLIDSRFYAFVFSRTLHENMPVIVCIVLFHYYLGLFFCFFRRSSFSTASLHTHTHTICIFRGGQAIR